MTYDDRDVLMLHLHAGRDETGIGNVLPEEDKSISCALDVAGWLLLPSAVEPIRLGKKAHLPRMALLPSGTRHTPIKTNFTTFRSPLARSDIEETQISHAALT